MPTFMGTIGLMGLRIIIGIIITFIFALIIMMVITTFYEKMNDKSKAIQENKAFSVILRISYMILLIVVSISFISIKGAEYSYRNRLGLISVTEQDQLYQRPGAIHKFFNPTARILISKDQLNQIKNYHLVPRNHKYELQRQAIVKKAQYRLHHEKKYYTSDN